MLGKEGTLHPAVDVVPPGEISVFICDTEGPKRWIFNDKRLPRDVQVRGDQDRKIVIRNVGQAHVGFYKCIVQTSNYTFATSMGKLELKGIIPSKNNAHRIFVF